MKQALYFLVSARGEKHGIAYDTLVGRSSKCDLTLDNIMVSRQHAILRVIEDGLEIEDLGSSNGTFIGEQRISTRRTLADGDRVTFGDVTFAVATNVDTEHSPLTIVQPQAIAEEQPPAPDSAAAAPEPQASGEAVSSDEAPAKAASAEVISEKVEPEAASPQKAAPKKAAAKKAAPKKAAQKKSTPKKSTPKKAASKKASPAEPVVEAPSAAQAETPADDVGSPGTIEVLAVDHNLPPAWTRDTVGGTIVLTAEDMDSDSQIAADDTYTDYDQFEDGATLIILNGNDEGRPYRLLDTAEKCFWTIGKDPQKQQLSIVIEDASVSDIHAKIIHKSGQWKIVDQMSTNFTRVNGEQFSSAFLKSGDMITLGKINMRFVLPRAAQPQEPAAAPASRIGAFFKKLFGRKTSD